MTTTTGVGQIPEQRQGQSSVLVPSKKKGLRKLSDEGLSTYLMLAPFVVLFIIFGLYPVFASLRLSFMSYNAICDPSAPCGSVFFDNYIYLLTEDTRFLKALLNTSYYVVGSVLLGMMASLGLALVLQENTRLNRILRVLFFLPAVTSSIATVLVWGWVFRGDSVGLINGLLNTMGLPNVEWLATPSLAMPILMFMSVWGGAGFGMVLFLAGLNAIPTQYYEAAIVDGASKRQRFRHITLPLLKPVMVYVGITSTIGAFQIFEAVYLLFPTSVGSIGGVRDMALMIVPYLYDMGFNRFRLGYASAIAWVLFAIIFVISMINIKLTKTLEDLR